MQKEKWDATKIKDQTGRIVIITGSSSGIGFHAANALANKNAKVIIAVRNLKKGDDAAKKIFAQNKNADIEVLYLDLAKLDVIRQFVKIYKEQYDKLDLLINNAGVMIPPYSKTADGFEIQFGTNHLGHFALTALLFDLIKNTNNSRVVNVSSGAHKLGNINFNDLNWEKRKYNAWKAYGDSKIANLYFTYELCRRLQNKKLNTKTTAAHPGWTSTELMRYSTIPKFLEKFFAMKPEKGALSILRAATDENAENGDFFGPDGLFEMRGFPIKVHSNDLSHDKNIATELWNISENLTDIKFVL